MDGQVLRATVPRKVSRVIVRPDPMPGAPPTVLTMAVTGPNSLTAVATRRSDMPSSSIEPATPTTFRPSACISFCASSTASGERPLMTTDAPSRARRVAVERPMLGLWVDPVTTATVPLKRMPALLSLMFPPWSRPDWRWGAPPEEELRSAGGRGGPDGGPPQGGRGPEGGAGG